MISKRKIILSFGVLVLLIVGMFAHKFVADYEISNQIMIESETVDNYYNNSNVNIMPQLLKINGKLYYNYRNNPLKYGTYEISDGVSKRIYWEGPNIFGSENLLLDYVYDDKILAYHITDKQTVEFFNINERKYEHYMEVECPDGNILKDYFVIDGVMYFSTSSYTDNYNGLIYRYENGNYELVISQDFCGEYYSITSFYKNYMYYINDVYAYDGVGNSNDKLYKYDMNTKQTVDSTDISSLEFDYIYKTIAFENEVYFILNKSDNYFMYKISFDNNSIEKIFELDRPFVMNGYEGDIYVAVESGDKKGLYTYDSKNKKMKKFYCDQDVCEVYIVDTKWIYFTNLNYDLYRITPDGKTLEKVFGF